LIILSGTLLTTGVQMFRPRPEIQEGQLGQNVLELQAKYLVGVANLMGQQDQRAAVALRQQLEAWKPSGRRQQLRVAILAGEVIGPEAARQRLPAAPQDASSTPPGDDAAIVRVLRRLYQDYAQQRWSAPSVTEAERRELQDQLQWFGRLALAPPGSEGSERQSVIAEARRVLFVVIGAFAAFGMAGLLGLFVLIVFVALLLAGKLDGLAPGGDRSGVYAEAFAVWLLLFIGLNIAGGLWLGRETMVASAWLTLAGSLLAVVWPRVRGVGWRELRQDLGWTTGGGLAREVLAGVGGYLMAIPLVVLALILTFALLGLAGGGIQPDNAPVHPIAGWLADASWWQQLQLVLLACVMAPLVEETMFRGFLYRHLREATRTWRRGISVLLSAVVSALLFAVLHPQGLLAVPAIVGIALGLAFVREWRDSLIPSLIAHGLNNTVVMVLLLTLLNSR
jgi:membrane protease YdiL (CAAX protease family)